jgi:hypothetical protein
MRPHDSILVYFATGSEYEFLGAFLVRLPPRAVGLDDVTALAIVDDPKLDSVLSSEEEYPRDPFLNVYTGMFLVKDNFPRLPKKPPKFFRNAIVAVRDGA